MENTKLQTLLSSLLIESRGTNRHQPSKGIKKSKSEHKRLEMRDKKKKKLRKISGKSRKTNRQH